ncbi:Piwi-domain-containing protein [Pleurotus eryngii]|uniref:Piwi-domain-containing protein n=1 Tax=Pleurotus eryngii TaxID=5323 RepID=A0A9P6DJP9_PLEER|nr:Piwi-domain-containing protein [Pleurotus eryngii]
MSNRQGRPLQVSSNTFVISRLPTKEYHQYSDFTPEQKNPRKRQEIMHELILQYPKYFNPRFAYDGRAIMYISKVLNINNSSSATLSVRLGKPRRNPPPGAPHEDRPGPPKGAIQVQLTLTSAETIRPMLLNSLIQYQGSEQTPQTAAATNLLQLLVRQGQNWATFPNNARAYYTEIGSKGVGGGFELWRGFFQSVRPSIGRMLINIDISMAAMYKSGSVLDVALDVLGARDIRALSFDARDPKFRKLERYFKKRMITVHTPAMQGVKRMIYGLEPKAGHFRFNKESGESLTVESYFRRLNNPVRYPDAFGIIISRPNDDHKQIIPAEFCKVVPGQFYKGKIPEDIQSGAIQKFSTMRPEERLKAIQTGHIGGKDLPGPAQQYPTNDLIHDGGMSIDFEPLKINGRVLDTPDLQYGGGQPFSPQNGAWNVVNKKFHTPERLGVWSVVNFELSIPEQVVENFARNLQVCCNKLGEFCRTSCSFAISYLFNLAGMGVADCVFYGKGNPQAPQKTLNQAFGEMRTFMEQHKLNPNHILILAILPQNAAPLRADIKYWGDVEAGVVTQCVRETKIFSRGQPKFNDQYCNNVALKLNARLGGTNSIPRSSALEQLKKAPYMIMGADVGHPGPGAAERPSVTSLVFSHDKYASHYAALSRVQPPRLEIIVDLREMVATAVSAFGVKNRAGPAAIVFFRDGVSEGEYSQVAEKEIPAIQAGIDDAWRAANVQQAKPKLTFIVVGKRHHVRFFPAFGRGADKSGNCPAGFVADTGIQSPFCADFYLLSHSGLLGTSRPSHYIILKDENFNNNVDDLQSLAFTLCHAYAKATRSVSIPAPVYYADMVCSRAVFYFDRNLDYTGSDTATVSSGITFNLDTWRSGYRTINGRLSKSMYFL